LSPAIGGLGIQIELASDLSVVEPLGRQQHDACSDCRLLGRTMPLDKGGERRLHFGVQNNGAGLGAALVGTRPIIEMRIFDFVMCAMDELVNQVAKVRYMFVAVVGIIIRDAAQYLRLAVGVVVVGGSVAQERDFFLREIYLPETRRAASVPATVANGRELYRWTFTAWLAQQNPRVWRHPMSPSSHL